MKLLCLLMVFMQITYAQTSSLEGFMKLESSYIKTKVVEQHMGIVNDLKATNPEDLDRKVFELYNIYVEEKLETEKDKKEFRDFFAKKYKDLKKSIRVSGYGVLITYVAGTILGYSLAAISIASGNPGGAAFFSIFPLGTVGASIHGTINGLVKNLKSSKYFNKGENKNYFKEYKNSLKKLKSINKVDLYQSDFNNIVKVKKSFFGLLLKPRFKRLTIHKIKKFLKSNNIYKNEYVDLLNDSSISRSIRVGLVVKKLNRDRPNTYKDLVIRYKDCFLNYENVITGQNSQDFMHMVDIAKVESADEAISKLSNNDFESISSLAFLNMFDDVLIPMWAENLKSVTRKDFICFQKVTHFYKIKSYKSILKSKLSEYEMIKSRVIDSLINCLSDKPFQPQL